MKIFDTLESKQYVYPFLFPDILIKNSFGKKNIYA